MNLILPRPANLFNVAGLSGNKTFNTLFPKKVYLLFTIFLVSSFAAKASNYYWVGGTGNWSEFATHWATSSGGSTFNTQVPQSIDNVFFDANSFSSGSQTITLDIITPTCNNMDWTGVTNAPTINGNSHTLKVYGSLTLVTGMTASTLNISFEATTTGKTITTAGISMTNLTLNGIGGGWTLQDALAISGNVSINNGTFDTNNQTISASEFTYSGSGTKVLTLGSSIINLSNNNVPWEFRNITGITFSAGTSTINLTNPTGCHFGGGGLAYYDLNFTGTSGDNDIINADTYHNVTFSGTTGRFRGGTIAISNNFSCAGSLTESDNLSVGGTATISGGAVLNGSCSFGTLNLNGPAGSTYTFGAGTTQTITTAMSVASGNCSTFTNFNSSSTGSQATISMASGSVTVNYVNLKDIKVQGGASFNATNAIDQGDNTGWTITALASRNLHWISGTGNWSDGSHWSLTSGGTAAGCAPTSLDNVFFDANSFSTSGQAVTLDITAPACNNMDWTGVTNAPTINGNSHTLKVYGSLTLLTGMTASTLNISFEATTTGKTITTAGISMTNLTLNGIGGGWTLQDALAISGNVSINNGTFDTNNQTISASEFTYSGSGTKVLTLGSSIINLSNNNVPWEFRNITGITFSAGTSTINLTNPTGCHFGGGGLAYYDLNFTGTSGDNDIINADTYHNVTFSGTTGRFRGGTIAISNNFSCAGSLTESDNLSVGGTATISGGAVLNGSCSFGTLNLTGVGATYTFTSGTTQTITTALNITGGAGGSPDFLNSSSPGTQATLFMASGSVCTDYIRTTDIKATGGAFFTAGPSSQNVSNTTGWTFISGVPNPTVTITANTGTTTCSGTAVTFTAAFTNGGLSQTFQWFVNGVSVQNSSLNTYTTSSLTDGAAVYCVISAFPTPCSFTLVVNSNTLNMTVNSNVVQSVSIGASATTISTGTSVTFTATPTNGGVTPAYQWQKNGSNAGTNSATYVDAALANNDVITCVMTSSITCLTTPTATSNGITMTVIGAPATQATNVTFTGTANASTTISWTNGDGASRAVFMFAGGSGSPAPVDLTAYNANAAFGAGDQIGSTGWYCVYNGTGSTVNITALTAATTYQVMAVEYNGTGSNVAYLTAAGTGNPAGVTTLTPVVISSLSMTGSSPTNAASVNYTATFGGAISGLAASNFSITASGTTGASVGAPATGDGGITWTVPVNTGTGDGTIQLVLANASGILPGISNTLPFAGDTYTVDKTAPAVLTIAAQEPSPTNETSLDYTVTFSEPITGVDASDFTVTATGLTNTGIGLTPISSTVYNITVNNVSGSGTLRVDLNSSGTGITDVAGNAPNGFTGGDIFTVDQTPPAVASVDIPADGSYGIGRTLDFVVHMSENTTVTGTPFIPVTIGGNTVNASFLSGNGSSTLTFEYTVVSGDNDSDGIAAGSAISLNGGTLRDAAGNDALLTLNSVGSTTGVLVDGTAPTALTLTYNSNHSGNSQIAITGDVVTLDFTASEAIQSPAITIAGHPVTATNPSGNEWIGNYTMTTGDTPGRISFTLAFSDPAGNAGPGSSDVIAGDDIEFLSPVATLANLATSDGALSPVFVASTITYSMNLRNRIRTITVTPTVTDPLAMVTVNGTTVVSGSPSAPIALSTGANTITAIVTAQDGVATRTYTINAARAVSANATLSRINLNSPFAPLTQVAGPDYKDYTATVNHGASSIVLTAVTMDPDATMTINGSPQASGTPTSPIGLNVGSNIITIVVKASNGTTTNTYVVNITRPHPSDALLSFLNLRPYALLTAVAGPGFKNYTASVNYATTSAGVFATTSDPLATFTVNGDPATSGTASTPIALNPGPNTFTIVVTAQDGSTKTFIITLTRALSSNATLSSLKTKPYASLTQVAGPDFRDYKASVANNVSSGGVIATTADPNASITVNGAATTSGAASTPTALGVGNNTFTIVVKAQDGVTTKTYVVTLNRAGSGPISNPFTAMRLAKPTESPQLLDGDIVVHQAISPNSDGANDFLVIDGITNYPDNKLMIVNRNGQLIYEAKGYDNSQRVFDGHSSKTGAKQLPGTYFYSLDYNVKGVAKHKTGFIILKY